MRRATVTILAVLAFVTAGLTLGVLVWQVCRDGLIGWDPVALLLFVGMGLSVLMSSVALVPAVPHKLSRTVGHLRFSALNASRGMGYVHDGVQ